MVFVVMSQKGEGGRWKEVLSLKWQVWDLLCSHVRRAVTRGAPVPSSHSKVSFGVCVIFFGLKGFFL